MAADLHPELLEERVAGSDGGLNARDLQVQLHHHAPDNGMARCEVYQERGILGHLAPARPLRRRCHPKRG
ncbi:MAG TPA: hypothetical protein VM899_08115, partial [Rubellimicrobium sp.]|nr:hypothetical protein [Rubellimicrobium sp.]